jgi:hypothetical protein
MTAGAPGCPDAGTTPNFCCPWRAKNEKNTQSELNRMVLREGMVPHLVLFIGIDNGKI